MAAILLVVIFLSNASENIFLFFTIDIVLLSFVPFVLIIMWAKHRAGSLELVDRKERQVPYVTSILFYLLCSIVLFLVQNAGVYLFVSLSYLAGTVVLAFCNHFTKVSVHSSGIAIFSTVLSCLFWPWGIFSFLLIPLVSWVRYISGKHTPIQLTMGMIIGVVMPMVVYLLFFSK
jgi:membrane-associated phospholipid phosphatase